MFKKELSTFEKIINAIFLIFMIMVMGDLLVEIINNVLPDKGDYSAFNLREFLRNITNNILILGLLFSYLKIVKKFSLFSSRNTTSKKTLNFLFSGIILMMLISFCNSLTVCIITYNKYLIEEIIELYLPYIVASTLGLTYINRFDILSSNKSVGLNFFNSVAILTIFAEVLAVYFAIIYRIERGYILIDLIRNILISLVPVLLFGFGIHFTNKGYNKKDKTYTKSMDRMDEYKRKYAELLLVKCLGMKEKKSLLIEGNEHTKEFADILKEEADKMGVDDVYISIRNQEEKHFLAKTLTMDEIKENPIFDKSIYNVYALKDAGILMLSSPIPDLMSDISNDRLVEIAKHERSTQEVYRKKQHASEVNWCIACIPNKLWASKVIGGSNSLNKLWDLIFDICLIKERKPIKAWEKQIEENKKLCKKLNDLGLKKLTYKNSLGTDLTIKLPEKHIWCGGTSNGLIVNMPTLEIFTSPLMKGVDGIVYSSKPLIYNNITIDNFSVEFKNGKVTKVNAKKGLETLKGIIETDDYSCYLGEVALVPYNSPISNTNVVFEDTLIDENASCHLAFGSSYPECLEGADKLSGSELRKLGVNDSKAHVDFMIGTSDLEIIGIDKNDKEVKIFENGNFSKNLK